MYYEFGHHQLPHFHARFGEYKATFTIMPPALLAGVMPRKQQNLILAWAELHDEELLENWRRIELEQPLDKIEGLR
jgi:hypothetical protein